MPGSNVQAKMSASSEGAGALSAGVRFPVAMHDEVSPEVAQPLEPVSAGIAEDRRRPVYLEYGRISLRV